MKKRFTEEQINAQFKTVRVYTIKNPKPLLWIVRVWLKEKAN